MPDIDCEKYRQMADGSLDDRIAVASSDLPYGCSSELYLKLSKDEHTEVRRALAGNSSMNNRCMGAVVCRVLGRLHKDRDETVRSTTKTNSLFITNCDGNKEMDYTVEPWYGFDVKRADVHCGHNTCNYHRLIGELEAKGADVVSIIDWNDNVCTPDSEKLRDLGFHYIPSKVSWQLHIDGSFEEYLDKIPKGHYIERRRKRLRKDNIVFIVTPVETNHPLEDFGYPNYYKQWYDIYKTAMQGKKRGRLIIKEDSPPTHLMAVYAVKDIDKAVVLGGILFNASKPGVISGAYGAFIRDPPGLSDCAMAEMVAYAYAEGVNKDIHTVNLGMDTNFYGFHLGTGLYSYKTSHGYHPYPFSSKREFFKVLDDSKFDNPYMFLDFPISEDEYGNERARSTLLRNNITLKGDKKLYLSRFDAPAGILLHHNDKKYRYHQPKDVFFQNGILASDYPRRGGESSANER